MGENYILVKTKKYVERIPTDEVLCVQRDGRKIRLTAEDKQYEYYGKIESVEEKLDERFYKCHGGCIINLDKVRLMEDQEIYFYNGESLFLGRTNFIKTKHFYYSYCKSIE